MNFVFLQKYHYRCFIVYKKCKKGDLCRTLWQKITYVFLLREARDLLNGNGYRTRTKNLVEFLITYKTKSQFFKWNVQLKWRLRFICILSTLIVIQMYDDCIKMIFTKFSKILKLWKQLSQHYESLGAENGKPFYFFLFAHQRFAKNIWQVSINNVPFKYFIK